MRCTTQQCAKARPGTCRTIVDWQEAGKRMSKAEKAMAAGDSTRPGQCAGRSLVERMEDELDAVVERLMTDSATEDGRDPGRAEGMAICIAILREPYRPDIDVVRNDAMLRYEASLEEDD